MKKLVISTLSILFLQILTPGISSANSTRTPQDFGGVIFNSTTDIVYKNCSFTDSFSVNIPLISIEKKKLYIRTKDDNSNTTASVIINLVSSSGAIIKGPFNLKEGEVLVLELESEQDDWEIDIVKSSTGAIIEYWLD